VALLTVKEMFRTVEIFSAMCQSFEVFTAILLQVQVFWDVTLSEVDQAKHSVLIHLSIENEFSASEI
jgi:hypothetical protein